MLDSSLVFARLGLGRIEMEKVKGFRVLLPEILWR